MGRLSTASGTADIEISRANIIDIEIIRPSDSDKGIPAYKVTLEYSKNYTVQTNDLATSVTDARRNVLKESTLTTVAQDATIKTQYEYAAELVRPTLLVDATAASTEATRVLNLYKVKRKMYQVRIALDVNDALPDLNGVANLTINRFGHDSGTLFRIIGISSSYAKNRATLTLWG